MVGPAVLHCNGISVYIFLFWELRGLSPNFHIHVFVSDLYIPRISPHISFSRKGRPIVGIYNSLTDTWMWKLGLRPRYSFSGNICFKFSAFFLCSLYLNSFSSWALTPAPFSSNSFLMFIMVSLPRSSNSSLIQIPAFLAQEKTTFVAMIESIVKRSKAITSPPFSGNIFPGIKIADLLSKGKLLLIYFLYFENFFL